MNRLENVFWRPRAPLRERSVTSEQFSCSGGTQECQEVLNPIPKQGTMPIFKLNAVMVIVSCSTTEAALLKMLGPSTRRVQSYGQTRISWMSCGA